MIQNEERKLSWNKTNHCRGKRERRRWKINLIRKSCMLIGKNELAQRTAQQSRPHGLRPLWTISSLVDGNFRET